MATSAKLSENDEESPTFDIFEQRMQRYRQLRVKNPWKDELEKKISEVLNNTSDPKPQETAKTETDPKNESAKDEPYIDVETSSQGSTQPCECRRRRTNKAQLANSSKLPTKPVTRKKTRKAINIETQVEVVEDEVSIINDMGAEGENISSTPVKLSRAAQRRINRLQNKIQKEIAKVNKDREMLLIDSPEIECIEIIDKKELAEVGDEIVIFVSYGAKTTKINMKKNQTFSAVFEQMATICCAEPTDILLCYEDRIIGIDHTPAKMNVKSGSLLDCYLDKNINEDPAKSSLNKIRIKFQSKNSKIRVTMHVHKLEKFSSILQKYAVENNLPAKDILFEFDGEEISGSDTPDSIGIEDDNCVDVKMITKI